MTHEGGHRTHRARRHGREPRSEHREPRVHRRRPEPDLRQGACASSRAARAGSGSSARRRSRSSSPRSKRPRRVMIMVKAGKPVDDLIEQLVPLLEQGDIIIDGGNTHFPDTHPPHAGARGARASSSSAPASPAARRARSRARRSCPAARRRLAARQADLPGDRGQGRRRHAVLRLGRQRRRRPLREDGAQRHRVRRHAAHLRGVPGHEGAARHVRRRDARGVRRVEQGRARQLPRSRSRATSSRFKDEDGKPIVDMILDTAGQKGTGKWTSVAALDLGHPADADQRGRLRALPLRDEGRARRGAQGAARAREPTFDGDREEFIDDLARALYASKIVSLRAGLRADARRGRRVRLGAQLRRHRAAVARRLHHPLGVPRQDQGGLRPRPRALEPAARPVLPRATSRRRRRLAPGRRRGGRRTASRSRRTRRRSATSTAIRNARLPANLLQAQRDYFGAHKYERIDQPRGEFFHTNWTGRGGTTASTAYVA